MNAKEFLIQLVPFLERVGKFVVGNTASPRGREMAMVLLALPPPPTVSPAVQSPEAATIFLFASNLKHLEAVPYERDKLEEPVALVKLKPLVVRAKVVVLNEREAEEVTVLALENIEMFEGVPVPFT